MSPTVNLDEQVNSDPEKPASTPDTILESAWKLLIQYDQAALRLKNRIIFYRVVVLLMGFFASLLAVWLGFIGPHNGVFNHLTPVVIILLPLTIVILGWIWRRASWRGTSVANLPTALTLDEQVAEEQRLNRLLTPIKAWMATHTLITNAIVVVAYLLLGLVLAILLAPLYIGPNLPTDFASLLQIIMPTGQEALRIILFALPLISAGIIAYVTKFIPSQLWAKYRYTAETARREIFLYRMNAGAYEKDSLQERQNALLTKLQAVENEADVPVTIFEPPLFDSDVLRAKVKKMNADKDDGFSPLTADQYIDLRLNNQYRWYTDKSFREYGAMGRWQVVALTIGGAGSLLAFLGHEAWVAVTTSAAVTVSSLASLMMYGRTYLIYHVAARNLRHSYNRWSAKTDQERANPKHVSKFVVEVENTFESEINIWIQQAKDAMEDSDLDALENVGKTPGGAKALRDLGVKLDEEDHENNENPNGHKAGEKQGSPSARTK